MSIGTCRVLSGPAQLTPFTKRLDAFSFDSDHDEEREDITAQETQWWKNDLKKSRDAKLWMELTEHTVRVPVVQVKRPEDGDDSDSDNDLRW